ncbi:MAG: efflux RND transporter periplasmic adaptor subunit [Sulfuricellaceae bacterium]
MKRTFRLVAYALAAVIILGGGFHFYRQRVQAANPQPAGVPTVGVAPLKPAALAVRTVQPEQAVWSQQLNVSGGIAPWQEAVIAAETSGLRVVNVAVDVGSNVRRGQVLAELARDSVEATLAQRQADIAKARASLAEAGANAERARKVKDTGAVSEQLINQYLIAEQSAIASLAAAQAALRSESIRLEQTRILAPDDGVISSRSATLGSVVQAGAELFRMIRRSRLEWRAEVSAEQLSRVSPGQAARLHLADGAQIDGTVRMIAPTLDVGARKALVYVDIPHGSGARAGMFASGEIRIGSTAAGALPTSALVLRDGHSYVFQVGPQNTVVQLKVETGRRQGSQVEILTPLSADARIVASGGAFLNDGDLVRVEATPAAKAQAK